MALEREGLTSVSRRAAILLGVTVALALVAAGVAWLQRPAVAVRVEPVRRGDLEVTVSTTATGSVESETEVNVRAEVAGRIARLLADEGDRVERGQVIAHLDQAEAEAQVRLARANLEVARARLRQGRAGVEMLAAQVRTRIDQTRANLQKARNDLSRMRALFAEGAVAQEQVESAQTAHDVADAAYQAALAERDQLAVKDQEVAVAEAAVAQMEAALRVAEVQLARTVIRSPVAGLITRRLVTVGETVGLGGGSTITLGGPMFTIVDVAHLYVRATVDEADLGRIRLGQRARVVVDAYPGRTFHGRMYRISPAVSGERQEARTVSIRVAVEGAAALLKPGMSADVEILVGTRQDTLSVPAQAILGRGGEKHVYILEQGRARLRQVRVGETTWAAAEILEGVREGELVVSTPDAGGLTDGARIAPRP